MSGRRLIDRISREIVDMILMGEVAPNAHLSTQKLADRFRVSRSPVREALQSLAEKGVVLQHANRGFFVREDGSAAAVDLDRLRPLEGPDPYYRLAEDWLNDAISAEVTEQYLRKRYDLTKSELMAMLNRATLEGWVERKQGYGWRFLPVAKTAEALEQIYRFRWIVEPAGLLEATFEVDWPALREQKRIQEAMLQGDIDRLPADRLMTINSQLHEELIRMSGNPFLHQAIIRVNRTRKLLEYRSMVDRSRVYVQSQEHLHILGLVEKGDNVEASYFMRRHLVGALAGKAPLHRRSGRGAEGSGAPTAEPAETAGRSLPAESAE